MPFKGNNYYNVGSVYNFDEPETCVVELFNIKNEGQFLNIAYSFWEICRHRWYDSKEDKFDAKSA